MRKCLVLCVFAHQCDLQSVNFFCGMCLFSYSSVQENFLLIAKFLSFHHQFAFYFIKFLFSHNST